jgi:hypothetical protein
VWNIERFTLPFGWKELYFKFISSMCISETEKFKLISWLDFRLEIIVEITHLRSNSNNMWHKNKVSYMLYVHFKTLFLMLCEVKSFVWQLYWASKDTLFLIHLLVKDKLVLKICDQKRKKALTVCVSEKCNYLNGP